MTSSQRLQGGKSRFDQRRRRALRARAGLRHFPFRLWIAAGLAGRREAGIQADHRRQQHPSRRMAKMRMAAKPSCREDQRSANAPASAQRVCLKKPSSPPRISAVLYRQSCARRGGTRAARGGHGDATRDNSGSLIAGALPETVVRFTMEPTLNTDTEPRIWRAAGPRWQAERARSGTRPCRAAGDGRDAGPACSPSSGSCPKTDVVHTRSRVLGCPVCGCG